MPHVVAAPGVLPTQGGDASPVRGEVRQTYQLSPTAGVEVTGIEGPVEVETTDGGPAEVHFTRTAQSQTEYDCEKLVVEHTPERLSLRRRRGDGGGCRVIRASERLRLTVPRSASLSFKGIEGDLTVGPTDGVLRLSGIEGYVRVAQTRAAEMRSLEKGLSLTVERLGETGVSVSNVEGAVEFYVAGDLNADLRITSSSGDISADLPGAQVSRQGPRSYAARLGAGGASISLSGIEGAVRVRRK
ncbi:MAG TPA: hypothetical protein VIP46_15850 [Pyrinomonadaceae bacterium]